MLASSATGRGALPRAARYSALVNEGITLRCLPTRDVGIAFEHVAVPRHADRHQVEVFATALLRIAREITGTALRPIRVTFVHPRCAGSQSLDAFFGCPITFGSKRDELVFSQGTTDLPFIHAGKDLLG